MIAYPARRVTVRILGVLAALLFACGIVAAGAQSASAHDELISTDPADGSTVAVLPAQISLTFGEPPLDESGGTVVEVTDAAGTVLNDGAATQDDNVITQELTPGATGVISVLWRVVSDDGHPVSGGFSFTVAEATTSTPTPTTETVSATPTATTSPADDDDVSALPWVIGGALLVVVIVVIVLMGARAGQRRRDAEQRGSRRDGER
ncbi:MAG: copper resistance protein CopC [Microbacterium sp.]|uniref:copper resistance CopC family protein n=1 Tax=Microbacterium sp. TaxID=51671 RepID=UPI0039E3DFCF